MKAYDATYTIGQATFVLTIIAHSLTDARRRARMDAVDGATLINVEPK